MFGYIGKNLINLKKVLSIEIITPSKYSSNNIRVTYENKETSFFTSENPQKDFDNILDMMKKDSE